MKTRTPWLLGILAPLAVLAALALVACAANRGLADKQPFLAGKVTPQMRSGSTELRTYQVVDWTAPDDRTLVVNAVDRSLYQARFAGRCTGLRLVDTIGFIIQEPPQLDKYMGVVLPDGTRCAFKSFTRIPIPPAQIP